MKYINFQEMPLVLTPADIADTLGIGRNTAYDLIHKEMRYLRVGSQLRITRESFIAYLKSDNKDNE